MLGTGASIKKRARHKNVFPQAYTLIAGFATSLAREPRAMSDDEFRSFLDANYDHLVGFVAKLVGDHHLAEDIVQQTVLNLHRHFKTIRCADAKAYFFRSLRNAVLDYWRSAGRHPAKQLGEEDPPCDAKFTEPDRSDSERRIRGKLREAVAAMAEDERRVFGLWWHVGRDRRAALKKLGVPMDGSKKAKNLAQTKFDAPLHRARMKLAAILGPEVDHLLAVDCDWLKQAVAEAFGADSLDLP